jgi:hypothetical protein
MIYIYGDSHANHFFKNLKLPHANYHQSSITMFRIGRDNNIINFNNKQHNLSSVICLAYGEVDCRCHIQRQINLGRDEDEVIHELVDTYFKTIKNNVINYKKVIIIGVIPPTMQSDYESLHGPILHEFPFIGTDAERVRYTKKVNKRLEENCIIYNYVYFNPLYYYTRADGTLKYELSDSIVHLGDNSVFLEMFTELYNCDFLHVT